MRRTLTVFGVLMLLAGGCGDDDAGGTEAPTTSELVATSGPVATSAATTTVTPSTTMATSTGAVAATGCEELADNFIANTQGMLDAYGDASFAELNVESVPPEWDAAGARWMEDFTTMGQQAQNLGCGDFLDQLICERQPQLDPHGDAGLGLIADNTPCGLEGTVGAAAAAAYEARSEAWYESQQ